jgi:predicted permease
MIYPSDWRSSVRSLVRDPGLAASAVVALGLGIGLTSLLFSLTYGIYYRGLPFPEGDRIMAISATNVANGRARLEVSVHDLADWTAAQRSFDELAGFQRSSVNVVVRAGQPERLVGAYMTANAFDVLRAAPLLGRAFSPADGAPGAPLVLVLGHGVWVEHFGSDAGVIGRPVRVNGEPATIVGVMPPGFAFPASQHAWMPLRTDPLRAARGSGPGLIVFGRLRAGVSRAEAQAEFSTLGAAAAHDHPDTHRNLVPVVQSYVAMMTGNASAAAAVALTLAMGFAVLLIACVNVANLLIARGASRTREMAICTALGASRGRLVAQQMADAFVLALAGTAVAIPLALAGVAYLRRVTANTDPPFWVDFRLDGGPLLFTAATAIVAALLAGALPALRASRPAVSALLSDGTPGAGGLRIGRISRALVGVEIVLSFTLVSAAGLMARSLANLGTVDYGFTVDGVLTARIILPEAGFEEASVRRAFLAGLQSRLAALPGVSAATLTTDFPGMRADRTTVAFDGGERASDDPMVRTAAIGPEFFETFGRPVLRGRAFSAADGESGLDVAIVNEPFAREYFGGRDPVGRRIRLGRVPGAPWLTIVGIAPDLYLAGAEGLEPAGVYVPLYQTGHRAIGLALRGPGATAALLPAVRAQVSALDPDMPVYLPRSLRAAIDGTLWSYVAFGPLWLATGASALFLATVGLYSLLAFAVRQRAREIGVRSALGARPADIVRFVARQVGVQVSVGLAAGAALAWAMSDAMRAMVFHVSPDDPRVFVLTAATLVAAAALAAAIPLRRALRIDPAEALRQP